MHFQYDDHIESTYSLFTYLLQTLSKDWATSLLDVQKIQYIPLVKVV